MTITFVGLRPQKSNIFKIERGSRSWSQGGYFTSSLLKLPVSVGVMQSTKLFQDNNEDHIVFRRVRHIPGFEWASSCSEAAEALW